jgi:hypothetical protein
MRYMKMIATVIVALVPWIFFGFFFWIGGTDFTTRNPAMGFFCFISVVTGVGMARKFIEQGGAKRKGAPPKTGSTTLSADRIREMLNKTRIGDTNQRNH